VRGFCFEMKLLLRTSPTDETIKRKDGPLVRTIVHSSNGRTVPLALRSIPLKQQHLHRPH
jgi:hypothetical protein